MEYTQIRLGPVVAKHQVGAGMTKMSKGGFSPEPSVFSCDISPRHATPCAVPRRSDQADRRADTGSPRGAHLSAADAGQRAVSSVEPVIDRTEAAGWSAERVPVEHVVHRGADRMLRLGVAH